MSEQRRLLVDSLSEADLRHLGQACLDGRPPPETRAALLGSPHVLESALADPRLFDALLSPGSEGLALGVTPRLMFAVIVHRSLAELEGTHHVDEWVGPGERLPVFGVQTLRQIGADEAMRLYLGSLLASFTRVASGSIWVRTRRGLRRRRFSELDPVRMAEAVEHLPPGRRAPGYLRLGDIALFLSGVFPDHTARSGLSQGDRERLERSAGLAASSGESPPLELLERVGAAWYRRAADENRLMPIAGMGPAMSLSEGFGDARRLLTYLSDRHLHRFDTGLMHPAASGGR